MTIHDEIRRSHPVWDALEASFGRASFGRHDDGAADAAELAVYETARALGYLTTRAAQIAANYGRSLNL